MNEDRIGVLMIVPKWCVLLVAICIVPLQSPCLIAQPQPEFSEKSLAPAFSTTLLPVSVVSWGSDGFWGQRLKACRTGMQESMTPLMLGADKSHFVHNFRIAAGLSDGRHRGPAWNDGDCYKWLEAVSVFYAQTQDPALRELLNETIPIIAAAQRTDGYLHTPVLIAARNRAGGSEPLADPANFEMYNMGHLMTAACIHAEVTGSNELLDVAKRAADFLDQYFSQPDQSIARHAICPAHYLGILDLYRTTGEHRYLQLCQRWLQMRDLVQGGGDDNQDRLPFRQQREAVGHAVRANYLYAGVADLYAITGDEALWESLTACWNSVHHRKIYITGGCGALYDGASPDGSEQQKSITRIHQAYGRNYQLPNATAHNETCAAIGNLMWNQRMWHVTQDAKYIDALENSLYNAILAGVSLDGQRFFYTNTLRQLDQMPTQLRWPRQRQAWISCYCCPPNVMRTIAQVGRYAYHVDRDATIVLLYGDNSLNASPIPGSSISLQQISSYPVDGTIQLTIRSAPSKPYTLGFRVPGWCTDATIKVNGQEQTGPLQPASIARIERSWQSGDHVEINLPMPVQYLSAHPLVEECMGQIAVRRGPLVYCLESIDLSSEAAIDSIAVPANSAAQWQVQLDDPNLPGIPLLRGSLLAGSQSATAPDDQLYRLYAKASTRSVQARLVPYFAWGNRGPTEMSVWLPIND